MEIVLKLRNAALCEFHYKVLEVCVLFVRRRRTDWEMVEEREHI
jgi:hypothetical protein